MTRSSGGILIAVVFLVAGCVDPLRQPMPSGSIGNPVVVHAESQNLFDAAVRVLRERRFAIYRQDARLGEIVTEPMTGQQMWELWRADSAGLYNHLESSTHTILRTVEARIYPVRDSQGQPVAGRCRLEVRAHTERVSVPEREVTAGSQMPSAYSLGHGLVDALALHQEQIAGTRPVYLGRDGRLEDWLIHDILRKAGATVSEEESAPVEPSPPALQ